MALSAFPFDDQDTTETQFITYFQELQDSGIADSYGGTGFAVSADGSGMNVSIQSGVAILRGIVFQSTAVESRSIVASGTSPRVDRVILRVNPTDNSYSITVLQGVPNGSAPALTQTSTGIYELSLATVQVDANVTVIAANKVSDDRRFVGSRVGVWTTATRPASPRKYRLGFNVTTGKWEYWTGSAWTDLIPATVNNSTKWNGYTLTVSTGTPSGTPTTDRIWIQPIG